MSVTEEGTYYALATDELGCSYLDSISITFEIPTEEVTVEICKNDVYLFDGDLLLVNTSSTHVIDGTDGCDSIVLINVLEIPDQESSFLGDDIISCMGTYLIQSPYENTIWNDNTTGFGIIGNRSRNLLRIGNR